MYGLHAAFGLGTGPGYDIWLYGALMTAAGMACLVRAVLVRSERLPWTLFGVGLLLWSAGEVHWSLALSDAPEVPVPSAADALYLALYPLLYVGLIRLARARLGHFGSRLGLDGAIAALAVAALAAAAALGPIFGAAEGDALAVATNLAYPLGDLVPAGSGGGHHGPDGLAPRPRLAALGGGPREEEFFSAWGSGASEAAAGGG